MRTARLKPEGLTAHDFASDSPVDFLVGDFFAADFFAGAFLVVAFFAGAFLVVDFLVVVFFAADFSEAALFVGSLSPFGGAGVAGAAGGSD